MKHDLNLKSKTFNRGVIKHTNKEKSLNINSYNYQKGLYYINNIGFKTFNQMFLYVIVYNQNLRI